MKTSYLLSRTAALALALLSGPVSQWAGIPEPDLVWYGKVLATSGGSTVRVTVGTLTWRIEPVAGGTPWTISTPLTNINDQFSFILRVRCETPEVGVAATPETVVLSTPATRYRRVTVTLDGQPLSLSNAPDQFAPLPTDRGRLEQIDLILGSALADSDGDGLADAWEQQFFGNLAANANDDSDSDGVSNLREFRAGTNPKDSQSLFELVEISPQPTGIRVRWSSQSNRSYRLRRATTLLNSLASYQIIQSGLNGAPPTNEFLDSTATTGNQYFYIIELED